MPQRPKRCACCWRLKARPTKQKAADYLKKAAKRRSNADHIRPMPTDADRPPVAPAPAGQAAPRMIASERLADDCETEVEFLSIKEKQNENSRTKIPRP